MSIVTSFVRRVAVALGAVSVLILAACASSSNSSTQPAMAATQPTVSMGMAASGNGMAAPEKAAVSNLPTIRIDAGSTANYTDPHGNIWLADTGFTGGDVTDRDASIVIENTDDQGLYHTEHYGMDSFTYPVPNGKYIVKLHFAETYDDEAAGPGTRVFSFNVQGKDFKDFDVFVKAGGAHKAYVESVPVEITNGKLDITFTTNVQNPEINGIEIIPAS